MIEKIFCIKKCNCIARWNQFAIYLEETPMINTRIITRIGKSKLVSENSLGSLFDFVVPPLVRSPRVYRVNGRFDRACQPKN